MKYLPEKIHAAAAVIVVAIASSGCANGPANCSTDRGVYVDEGVNMAPGGNCIDCHARDEGPDYLIAGTVMGKANDDDDCAGISGVTVRVTDAKGVVLDLPTTPDGNFFYGGGGKHGASVAIAFPYTAKVMQNGKERAMVAAQTDGNCASCHTAEGANGAPGRILAP